MLGPGPSRSSARIVLGILLAAHIGEASQNLYCGPFAAPFPLSGGSSMARTRFLVSVCAACVVGSGLVPGVAQAARLLPTATPPARPTASLVDDLAPGPASSN